MRLPSSRCPACPAPTRQSGVGAMGRSEGSAGGGGGSFLGLIGFSPLPGCPKQVRASPFLPSSVDSSPYQREEREGGEIR